jgi:hypothetical protein
MDSVFRLGKNTVFCLKKRNFIRAKEEVMARKLAFLVAVIGLATLALAPASFAATYELGQQGGQQGDEIYLTWWHNYSEKNLGRQEQPSWPGPPHLMPASSTQIGKLALPFLEHFSHILTPLLEPKTRMGLTQLSLMRRTPTPIFSLLWKVFHL